MSDPLPLSPAIPPSWLEEAGAVGFVAKSDCYLYEIDAAWPTEVVSLEALSPPQRAHRVPGLNHERSVAVLKAIVFGTPLPPIRVFAAPDCGPRHLRVRDGYHRFHISAALGFKAIPVTIWPAVDMQDSQL